MTPAEQVAYLGQVVGMLREARPELLRPMRGKWNGPHLDPERCPAGPYWRGPKLMITVSPWDTTGRDENLWLHVSVSRRDRCPDYEELTAVRNRFFRDTDTVLHVWPPRTEHFSLHPFCLHLWTPLDGSRPIPDLRGQGGGV